MKVDNIPNLIGKYKQISYGGNRIEVGDIIKFQNVLDDDQVYIDIKTKDTNLNLDQILNLQNQINIQKTQMNLINVQLGVERLLNKNQTKEIFLNKQHLKNLEILIAQNFKEHDDLNLSLPQWVTDFKNDYDQKIILFDGLYLDQIWMYSLFKRQITKINVDIYDIYETLEDLKSVTNTTEGTSMAGVITAALAMLGITGSTIGLSVWISGISAQVQVNTAGIAALQAQMGVVKAALDIEDVVGDVQDGVKKVTEKIQNMAEIVAEQVLTPWQKIQKLFKYGQQAYNIGSTIWQSINQSQTEEGMTKLERIEQTFEFDCEDGLMYDGYADVAPTNNGLKYMTINDHVLLDKKYEFKCYDIHAQAGKIKNYDELFANHKQRLDTISTILGLMTDQTPTPVVATSTVYEYYKNKTSAPQGSNIDNSYTDEYPQQEMKIKGKTIDVNKFYIQRLQDEQDSQDILITQNTQNISDLQIQIQYISSSVITNKQNIFDLQTTTNRNTSDIITLKTNNTNMQTNINTINNNLNVKEGYIQQLLTKANSNTQRIEQLETDVGNNYNYFQLQIASIKQNVSDYNQNIKLLQTKVNTNVTDITNLKTSVQTNTSDISTLQNNISTNTSDIVTLQSNVSINIDNINSLQTQTQANTNNIQTLQNQIQNINLDNLQTNIQTNTNDIVALQTQTQTNTANITTLENNISNVQYILGEVIRRVKPKTYIAPKGKPYDTINGRKAYPLTASAQIMTADIQTELATYVAKFGWTLPPTTINLTYYQEFVIVE